MFELIPSSGSPAPTSFTTASFQEAEPKQEVKGDKADSAWRQGNECFQNGQYKKAITYYDQALHQTLEHPSVWVSRGNALQSLALGAASANQRSRRLHEAIASYRTALHLRPNYPEALLGRGIALYSLGRYQAALKNYDAAIALHQITGNSYSEDWYVRGIVLHQLGRYEEAIVSYDRALTLNPNETKAWVKRGMALQQLGREAEALDSYDSAATSPVLLTGS